MSETIYNPLEDNDVRMPVFKRDGKNLVVPAFICGVKTKELTSKQNESLSLTELEFEVDATIEKLGKVTVFHEDEDGNYNYRAAKTDEESVPATTFIGQRFKGGKRVNLWKNNTKGSGKMNRLLLDSLRALGVEIKTKKIEHEGKKIEAPIVPNPNAEMLLGTPVFVWLDQESFTNKNGQNVTYTCINKVVKRDGADKVVVLANTLTDSTTNNASALPKEQSSPFGDVDDDLPF